MIGKAFLVWCIALPIAVVSFGRGEPDWAVGIALLAATYALIATIRPLRGQGRWSLLFHQRRYIAAMSLLPILICVGVVINQQQEEHLARLKLEEPDNYLAELKTFDEQRWLAELEVMRPEEHARVLSERQQQIAALEAKVRKVPYSETETNLDIYRQLQNLDPDNERYAEKVSDYTLQLQHELDKKENEGWAEKNCDSSDDDTAFVMSQTFVKRHLKAPRSARFPHAPSGQSGYLGECRYIVRSYVDATNSFGGEIRTPYVAVLEQQKDGWILEDLQM